MPSARLVDVLDADIDQDVADDLPHVLIVVDDQHRDRLHQLVDAAARHRIHRLTSLSPVRLRLDALKQVRVRAA